VSTKPGQAQHAIDPKRVVYSEDAHERVPEVVSAYLEGKNVAVTADAITAP